MSRVGSSPPIPPGKDDFSTITSPDPVSRARFEELLQMDGSIVIYGRILYTDSTESRYETGFCLFHFASGAKGYCQGDDANYMK